MEEREGQAPAQTTRKSDGQHRRPGVGEPGTRGESWFEVLPGAREKAQGVLHEPQFPK